MTQMGVDGGSDQGSRWRGAKKESDSAHVPKAEPAGFLPQGQMGRVSGVSKWKVGVCHTGWRRMCRGHRSGSDQESILSPSGCPLAIQSGKGREVGPGDTFGHEQHLSV